MVYIFWTQCQADLLSWLARKPTGDIVNDSDEELKKTKVVSVVLLDIVSLLGIDECVLMWCFILCDDFSRRWGMQDRVEGVEAEGVEGDVVEVQKQRKESFFIERWK